MTEPRVSLHGTTLIAWKDGAEVARVPLTVSAALGLLADLAEALARQHGRMKVEREDAER